MGEYVNTVTKLRVSEKVGCFLTKCEAVEFPRKIMYHDVM
jgi:hypothetical protein